MSHTYLDYARHDIESPTDTVVVADQSLSMDANDLLPTRLAAVFIAIFALIVLKRREHPLDRVAIVGFGSSASVHCPLVDVGNPLLDEAMHKAHLMGGTNIAAGLVLAHSQFKGVVAGLPVAGLAGVVARLRWIGKTGATPLRSRGRQQHIILLSDGCNAGGFEQPVSVAERAKNDGVVISTIGVAGSVGAAEFDEAQLKAIASLDEHGTPRYTFITDAHQLVRKFEELAGHLRVMPKSNSSRSSK